MNTAHKFLPLDVHKEGPPCGLCYILHEMHSYFKEGTGKELKECPPKGTKEIIKQTIVTFLSQKQMMIKLVTSNGGEGKLYLS